MAVKDVVEYYVQVQRDYNEMLADLKDFEKECSEGIVEPERLEQFKQTIQPLKNNYETLSWIMFLLNKPVRKSKEHGYVARNKKLLAMMNKNRSKEAVLNEDQEVLNELRKH